MSDSNSSSLPPSLCILMITETKNEARVMRQAEYLSRHYRTTVAGMGGNPFTGELGARVTFVPMAAELPVSAAKKIWNKLRGYTAIFGALVPGLYAWSFRRSRLWNWSWNFLGTHPFDVVLVHDPIGAPLTAEVRRKFPKTKVLIDWHEYAPKQFAHGLKWKLFERPLTIQIMKRYGRQADGHLTISSRFCDLYEKDYGFRRPVSVLNTPMPLPEPRPAKHADGSIHLMHHGSSSPGRELHKMVQAMGLLPERFVLHLMLMKGYPDYIAHLKKLAEEVAPGRVFFDEPVVYKEILPTVARCHIGVFLLPANTFNHAHSLANKLFDFLCAGLPIVVSPCPDQAELVSSNGIGWVTDDFTPESMAQCLSRLTDEDIAAKCAAVAAFTQRVNAETQHDAVVTMIDRLLQQPAR